MPTITTKTLSEAFKEIYEGYTGWTNYPYYMVDGAKEELLARLSSLSASEKAILGLEDDKEEGEKNL